WLHRTVANAGYPAAALLEALLIGSREDVPDTLYGAFQRTGSLHILALSGLHVTVIYGIVAGLLGFIRSRGARFAIATAVLLFYQALAGFMPSLLRATVMIVVAGVALLADRDREPMNALALSGLVILLIDPFQAASLSFQLSFLALLGILAVSPLLERAGAGFVPRFLLAPAAMAAGAQVATLPVVIVAFGAYYPSGLVAGLLLVPLTTIFLWIGLAWLVVAVIPVPGLHGAFAAVFDALYRVIDGCARLFGRLPGVEPDATAAPWIAGGAGLLLVLFCAALPTRARPRAVAA
ncbi:MAG TPA: ComEC/Rec2 family competence protein, partial [Spirochaetia bacterium]